jgi:hypothetical protein
MTGGGADSETDHRMRPGQSDHRYHRVPQWHWDLVAEAERQRYERLWYVRLWRWTRATAERIARRITG